MRERTAALGDTMHTPVLPQAGEAAVTTGERGALDGSAVAANASRRWWLNAAWLAKPPRRRAAPCERDRQAQATDAGTCSPMLARTEPLTGRRLKEVGVDSGSVPGIDFALCAQAESTLYGSWKAHDVRAPETPRLCTPAQGAGRPELETSRCPAGPLRKRVGRATGGRRGGREAVVGRYGVQAAPCQACPLRAHWTTSHTVGRRLRRSAHEARILAQQAWMEIASAKAVYRLRTQTIEWVCAALKDHRGLRRCSGHGRVRVRTAWAWEVLGHHLLVLHRSLRQQHNARQIEALTEEQAA